MIHIFDLDLTLWETFDKHGNPIWAKQLIFPLSPCKNDQVFDDVGSKCVLKKGVRQFLSHLFSQQLQIGFISAGRHWDLEDYNQPSLKLLQIFGVLDFFNGPKILVYKNHKKSQFLNNIYEEITFYDDDQKVIEDLKVLNNIKVIDAKEINDWTALIKDPYA